MQFSTTSHQALNNGIKCCVYGRSGAGKTRLIRTAPRPLILSVEGGTLSLAADNIPCIIVKTRKDLDDAYLWINTAAEAKQFDTVALDSISEFAEVLLSEEKAKSKDPRQAYGEMMDKTAVLIRLWRDIPNKNVYFTAKAALTKQPDGSELYSASMPGTKTANGLPYFFDEFFFLGQAEMEANVAGAIKRVSYSYLLTQSDLQHEAKDRSGALLPMEKPDLGYIFDKIRATVRSS